METVKFRNIWDICIDPLLIIMDGFNKARTFIGFSTSILSKFHIKIISFLLHSIPAGICSHNYTVVTFGKTLAGPEQNVAPTQVDNHPENPFGMYKGSKAQESDPRFPFCKGYC